MRHIFNVMILILAIGCTSSKESYLSVFEGKPRINDPIVVGNYPNTDFLFAVPTSGERPITWSALNLPEGLKIDPETGIITGIVTEKGKYDVEIKAKNKLGSTKKNLIIKIGDTLALTPPMGWNSWNTFTDKISDTLVRQTADYMVSSGMRDLGYQYVNIDDFWQLTERDNDGNIQINREKFPKGIKAVADYIHSKGLKLGIYSCASNRTCGGVAGSYGYEERDALAFAEWGVDLLKYDYCWAPTSKDSAIVRYSTMGSALKASGRSIVFSVCEWGAENRQPWTWAADVGGHYWRTTWDIRNIWTLHGSQGIIDIFDINQALSDYAGPGRWNDPDMLVVGINEDSSAVVTVDKDNGQALTLVEQQTHMSLWALMASPLLCGNDIRTMGEYTRSILLNPEIIAINQDILGKQARKIRDDGDLEVLAKPLSDGSWAVGLLNRSDKSSLMNISADELELNGRWYIRDVWKHRNMGRIGKIYTASVPSHGCHVVLIYKKTNPFNRN